MYVMELKNRLYYMDNKLISRTMAAVCAVVAVLMIAVGGHAAGLPSAGCGTFSCQADSAGADTVAVDTLIQEADELWPANVERRIKDLLGSDMFETSTVGMLVYDLTADSVIFRHNEKQLMRPASTLKMMVAVAALDRLGDDYEYATKLYMTGEVNGRMLDGDLYCRGGFDPVFDRSDMNTFVNSVLRLGIDTVRGRLYADVSMKDSDRMGEGWCWDDDNPALSPLLISGKDEFAGHFLAALNRAGIVVTGEPETRRVPRNAVELCTVRRKIGDILPRMMKNSDNLYSESVFYHLAASGGASLPVTAKHGRRVMNRLIEKLGYKPSDYYIADGSGLSLYNYVSPELEVAFLKYAYHDDHIYVPLYMSMPVAGEDGTLDERMRRGYARGNVHAKTGTVTGVSALAGYCTAANGHTLCFSIINMGIRHSSSARRFQDRVCEALCRP